jgi:lipopolysaccharide/colanic/teichoic acid biosynthesis glycosyltransferase
MSRQIQFALKRAFDLMISGAALILLSPVIALIALAIRLDDHGPIIFSQERVGKAGRPFAAYKFRTMIVGAEKVGLGLAVRQNDERITRVGRFLRHWTLDEIPQIFNVLKGDMSIVGPRPTVMSQVARYTPFQRRRLEVQPGMAGWAWIHGRNRLPWAKRIELDVWYVDHWSFWLDGFILFKAFLLLLRREGVYGDDGVVRDL